MGTTSYLSKMLVILLLVQLATWVYDGTSLIGLVVYVGIYALIGACFSLFFEEKTVLKSAERQTTLQELNKD